MIHYPNVFCHLDTFLGFAKKYVFQKNMFFAEYSPKWWKFDGDFPLRFFVETNVGHGLGLGYASRRQGGLAGPQGFHEEK